MALIKPPPKKGSGGPSEVAANPLKAPAGAPAAPGSPAAAAPQPKPAAAPAPTAARPAQPPAPARPAQPGPARPGAPGGAAIRVGQSLSQPGQRPGQPGQPGQAGAAAGTSRVTLSRGGSRAGGALSPAKQAAQAAKNVPDKIEEKVFALPGLEKIPDSIVFNEFSEKIRPKIRLPATSYNLIKAFSNIDVNSEKVAQCLKSNPYYEMQFLKVIESMGKREELPSLEAAVILLGMQNSRNLIVGLQLLRAVKGTHPEWSKEGKLKVAPNELLKYALRTEEVLSGNKGAYADMGYAAGLIFDILVLLADEHAAEKKKVLGYLDFIYTHSLKTAQIGVELAKQVPEFGFSKFIFGACLIHDIGKVAMAILNPDYLVFTETVGKRDVPRAVRVFAERRRFGVGHDLLGGIICHQFRMFRPVEKAVLYHHAPYLLKNGNKNLFQLASVICLATNIANNFKKPDKADDPVVLGWKGLDLKDFRLDLRSIMAAVSKVV